MLDVLENSAFASHSVTMENETYYDVGWGDP
jgi:hypothetical protein